MNLTRSLLLLAALVIPALAISSCSGTATSKNMATTPQGPVPTTMVLLDHRNDLRMTLISDSWMVANKVPGDDFEHRRSAFHSQRLKGDNLKVKVVQDAVAAGIWQAMRDVKFEKIAHKGKAPGDGQVTSSIEFTMPDGVVHVGSYPNMTRDEIIIYRECKFAYTDLYNAIAQLQAVDRMPQFIGAPKRNP